MTTSTRRRREHRTTKRIDARDGSTRKGKTISVVLVIEIVACLEILGDPEHPEESAAAVLAELADRARGGVTRPGSWERPWLCQAFGDEWTGRLEPDPEAWWCERPRIAGQTRRIRG